jgi:hypothetical protein
MVLNPKHQFSAIKHKLEPEIYSLKDFMLFKNSQSKGLEHFPIQN